MIHNSHYPEKKFLSVSVVLCFYIAFAFFTASVMADESNVIKGVLEEDLTITQNTRILGIVEGNVVITNNSTLTLDGIIIGKVTIETGSTFYLNGIVWGDVDDTVGTLIQTGIIEEGPLE